MQSLLCSRHHIMLRLMALGLLLISVECFPVSPNAVRPSVHLRGGTCKSRNVSCRMAEKEETVEISAEEYEELLRKAGRLEPSERVGKTSKMKLKDALTGFFTSEEGKDLMEKASALQVAGKEDATAEMTKGLLGGGGEGAALRAAAKEGNINRIEEILQTAETSPDAAEFPSGATPLMLAAAEDNEQVVRVLLEAGAQVDRLDIGGLSALHKAAQQGAARAAAALLEGGAVASLPSPEHSGAVLPLHWAASASSTETIETLLQGGADVTARDARGFTALHVAAAKDAVDCVKLLLEKGALADSKNAEGLTPLEVAKLSKGEDAQVLPLLA